MKNKHLFDPAIPTPNKERPFLPRLKDGGILGRLGEGLDVDPQAGKNMKPIHNKTSALTYRMMDSYQF